MEDRLSKEEVLHVAYLAKIKIKDNEMEKYQIELKTILDSIKKIKEVTGYDDEILIAPFSEDARLRDDVNKSNVIVKDILKNVPRHSGNYIEVPVVINE